MGIVVADGPARHAGRFQLAGHGASDGLLLSGDALHGQKTQQTLDGRIFVEGEFRNK